MEDYISQETAVQFILKRLEVFKEVNENMERRIKKLELELEITKLKKTINKNIINEIANLQLRIKKLEEKNYIDSISGITSSTAGKKNEFDIGEAVKRLKQGRLISKQSWVPNMYLQIRDTPTGKHIFCIEKYAAIDGSMKENIWIPNSSDLLATDYIDVT